MTPPPWKPTTEEERREFTQWIHRELDRIDEAKAEEGNNPFIVRTLEHRVALLKLAREASQPITFVQPKRRPGAPSKPPSERTAFDWAVLDVPRIRAIFVSHWGKRNRTVPPMAEQIAAERWELSAEDTARLIDKFQRKS